MTPHFRYFLAGLALVFLSGCDTTLKILEGADYACGNVHVEGYIYSDSQGDIKLGKMPDTWTVDDFAKVCPQ